MRRRDGLILIILGLITAWIAAQGVGSPGYMDADYYFAMGGQWLQGLGAEEPFLWNFLDQSKAIPVSSHGYWSPLTSMIIGVSMKIFGNRFASAQLPFMLFTSVLPILVWRLALAMGSNRTQSLQSGLLALAPGYYLPFFVTTDLFSLYALLGVLLMLMLRIESERFSQAKWLVIGLLCGLGHLSRADGFLLLIIPLAFLVQQKESRTRKLSLLAVGYLIVMSAWFYRNLTIYGTPLNSAGGRTLWLLSYDELFSFPAHILTPERWWAAGLDQILRHRWTATLVVLQRILAENGLIFLAPLMILGLKAQWQQPLVRSTTYYLMALFIVMTMAFPFAGARGGWFHSSVAAMPLLWVLAPHGLKVCVDWLGNRRGWDLSHAAAVFGGAMIGLAVLLTWGLYFKRANGISQETSNWDLPQARYEELHKILQGLDPEPGVVAINNPPGFHHVSGLMAVALPNGDLDILEQVVDEFEVSWIILDANHPGGLSGLFNQTIIPLWLKLETSSVILGESYMLYRVIEV
jgi:hypothetical protein